MFIAALFTKGKNQNQCECSSVGEWLKEFGHIHAIEYTWCIQLLKESIRAIAVDLEEFPRGSFK